MAVPSAPEGRPQPDADDAAGSTRPGVGERVRRVVHGTRHLWRTSLQFRVVVTSMLLGTVLTLILQSFLYSRVADGLVSARMSAAQDEAAFSAREVRAALEATDQSDAAHIQQFAYDVVSRQENQSPEQNREIILTRAIDDPPGPVRIVPFDTGIPASVIPTELRRRIAADPAHQQVQIVAVPAGPGGALMPAVVVGTQIQIPEAGPHELYYLFPMQREEETMAMVWRVFLLGSIALVALLGLVAFIVTRLVVDPLRQASEVATRLSGGHLNERMLVRGEDDIARLAMAFNDMAEHLQAQIRQLEDLSRVQQRFVSDVSHELRTPLTTIHMASEVIHDQRDSFDPVVARTTELLHTQVERFESLLADLLEISRFDAGGAVLDLETVDVRSVLARTLDGVRHLAEAKGSELVVVGDDSPHRAAIDPRRVDRILRNLLVNAIEHGEGRPVTVELGSDEHAVAVVVADQGIGLRPGQADLVFNRFWRADPSRKRTTGGTGLGLAISLEDAHLHRGWLQAWGEPDHGSRFRLTLPRTEDDALTGSPLPLEPPAALRPEPSSDAPTDLTAVAAEDGAATRDDGGESPLPGEGTA